MSWSIVPVRDLGVLGVDAVVLGRDPIAFEYHSK